MRNSLAQALTTALKTVSITDKDKAAVRLAFEYARQIDDGEPLNRLGPAYLAILESLGMTPRARSAITGKGVEGNGSSGSPLDELRAKRAKRANNS